MDKDEQAFIDRVSPGYRGLDANGDSENPYFEGWNDALDAVAMRLRRLYRDEMQRLQADSHLLHHLLEECPGVVCSKHPQQPKAYLRLFEDQII